MKKLLPAVALALLSGRAHKAALRDRQDVYLLLDRMAGLLKEPG